MRDVGHWPRPSVTETRRDLIDLTTCRALLWEEILAYTAVQGQVLSIVAEAGSLPAPPQRSGRVYARNELVEYSRTLAMCPHGADLLERLVVGLVALDKGQNSCLTLPCVRRGRLHAVVMRVKVLHDKLRRQRSRIINKNLRLVFAVAKRFKSATISLEDMLAEGNLGLIRAVDRFDIRHDVRFSTYAIYWIRHAIGRFVDDQSRTVRIPVNARMLHRKVVRARTQLRAQNGEAPTDEQVAAFVGAKLWRVRSIDVDMLSPASLEDECSKSGLYDGKIGDTLVDCSALPDEVMSSDERERNVRGALEHLLPAQAKILRERYGLDDDNPRTLQQIGNDMDLSRERIRQIQVSALDELRRHARAG